MKTASAGFEPASQGKLLLDAKDTEFWMPPDLNMAPNPFRLAILHGVASIDAKDVSDNQQVYFHRSILPQVLTPFGDKKENVKCQTG